MSLQKKLLNKNKALKGSQKNKVFLITGETGHGKSTLINMLMGKLVAIEAQKG